MKYICLILWMALAFGQHLIAEDPSQVFEPGTSAIVAWVANSKLELVSADEAPVKEVKVGMLIHKGSFVRQKANSDGKGLLLRVLTPTGCNSYSVFPVYFTSTSFSPKAYENVTKLLAGEAIRGESEGFDMLLDWWLSTIGVTPTEVAHGFTIVFSPSKDSLRLGIYDPLTFRLSKDVRLEKILWSLNKDNQTEPLDKGTSESVSDGYRIAIPGELLDQDNIFQLNLTFVLTSSISSKRVVYIHVFTPKVDTQNESETPFLTTIQQALRYRDEGLDLMYLKTAESLGLAPKDTSENEAP